MCACVHMCLYNYLIVTEFNIPSRPYTLFVFMQPSGTVPQQATGAMGAAPPSLDPLPLYPSSLLLATDVEVSIGGLRDISPLYPLAYEPVVTGQFGPFSFGYMFHTADRGVKFRVEPQKEAALLYFPGTHLIGYLCKLY